MQIIGSTSSSQVIRGFNQDEFSTIVIKQNPYIVTPSSAGYVTIQDAYISQQTSAVTENNVNISANV
jgi:hypothetical protein